MVDVALQAPRTYGRGADACRARGSGAAPATARGQCRRAATAVYLPAADGRSQQPAAAFSTTASGWLRRGLAHPGSHHRDAWHGAIRFAEATPSARAWCTLPITATRLPAIPSAKYISHSGWPRSSGVLADLADHLVEFPSAARAWHLNSPQVVVEIHLAVLQPHRVMQFERHVDQSIAQWFHQRKPLTHGLSEYVERQVTLGVSELDDADLQGTGADVGGFALEQHGIPAVESLHTCLFSTPLCSMTNGIRVDVFGEPRRETVRLPSSPARPRAIGHVETTGRSNQLQIADRRAYVSAPVGPPKPAQRALE